MKKVETQNLASHKQGYAINRCETCLSMLRFLPGRRKECIYHQHIIVRALLPWIARETQDFASLLG